MKFKIEVGVIDIYQPVKFGDNPNTRSGSKTRSKFIVWRPLAANLGTRTGIFFANFFYLGLQHLFEIFALSITVLLKDGLARKTVKYAWWRPQAAENYAI